MGLFSCFGGQPALVETIEQPNKKHDAGFCSKMSFLPEKLHFCILLKVSEDAFLNKIKFQNQ